MYKALFLLGFVAIAACYTLDFNIAPANTASLKKITLWATNYYTPILKNNEGTDAIRDKNGNVLAKVTHRHWCDAAMEGALIVDYGGSSMVALTVDGSSSAGGTVDCSDVFSPSRFPAYKNCKSKFVKTKYVFGNGSYKPLVPFRTVAVDHRTIPYGTVLYIPGAKGVKITLPNGTTATHDGFFIAGDTGGAIKQNHIDVFTGSSAKSPFSFVKSTSSGTFTAYIVTDAAVKNTIIKQADSMAAK